jgi:hypothetical protein
MHAIFNRKRKLRERSQACDKYIISNTNLTLYKYIREKDASLETSFFTRIYSFSFVSKQKKFLNKFTHQYHKEINEKLNNTSLVTILAKNSNGNQFPFLIRVYMV